jgi:hypothetical protein
MSGASMIGSWTTGASMAAAWLLAVAGVAAQAQTAAPAAANGPRMEIVLERLSGAKWLAVDPGLVLDQGDRVRFRFRANFDGYLYVTNRNSSGAYEQLYPRAETGSANRVLAGREFHVPESSAVFRISGPAGYETVYWLVTPERLPGNTPSAPPPAPTAPPTLIPRCDDTIFQARGECVDPAAGPKLVPRGEALPRNLELADRERDLLFLRQKNTAVISSRTPLAGPVVYEYRLAHR